MHKRPIPDGPERAVIEQLLDVLLRMIPDYCLDMSAEQVTDSEHDAAIAVAAEMLYGTDARAWPLAVLNAASGAYS